MPITQLHLAQRPRRLRASAALRELVAEVSVRASDLIAPYFVVEGQGQRQPIASLPGVARLSVDALLPELEQALALGIRAVMLFGVVDAARKTPAGEFAYHPHNPVIRALAAAKRHFGAELVLMSDICLCAYTTHGHCGLLRGEAIDNDASVAQLARMAQAHAEAGADVVCPSDMMDGRVGAIRQALDAAGLTHTAILSYAVKYASAFYGPFREAAASAPGEGPKDRASYQLDVRRRREALREAALDEAEGADLLMVKPALPCLDVLAQLRKTTTLPLVAYQVSGEYAMLKAAAAAGALDEAAAVREALVAMKRAGAQLIVTYYATEALTEGWLQ